MENYFEMTYFKNMFDNDEDYSRMIEDEQEDLWSRIAETESPAPEQVIPE